MSFTELLILGVLISIWFELRRTNMKPTTTISQIEEESNKLKEFEGMVDEDKPEEFKGSVFDSDGNNVKGEWKDSRR